MSILEKSTAPVLESDSTQLSVRKKAAMLLVLVLSAGAPGLGSTLYFPGLPDITREFNVPSILTTLTAALYVLFTGVAPVFIAAASEFFCIRRPIMIISMVVFTIASIGIAVVNSIAGLIALRCVQAAGVSSIFALGPAIIADCYPIEQRGRPIGIFYFGVFFGPLFGPFLGGFLVMSTLTWRAAIWFCAAFGGLSVLLLWFFLPETYRDVDTTGNNSKTDPEKENGNSYTFVDSLRPFRMIFIPHILLGGVLIGCGFGCLLTVETILPDLLLDYYGFNSWQIGLSYLGCGVGNMVGSFINARFSDRLLLRARERRGGRAMAEDRLAINLWPACMLLMPFGLLLLGWGVQNGHSYWTAIIGFGIMTAGTQQLITASSAYLVDSVPGKGASASAAGGFVSMVITCVFVVTANPLVHSIGVGLTSVVLTGIAMLSLAVLLALKLSGESLRRRSGFGEKDENLESSSA